MMNRTCARFKYYLHFCKSVANRAKADSLAKRFLLNDNVNFWKDIKQINRSGGGVLASTVGGVTMLYEH